MGMTIAEKILAKASGRDKVKPGEFVTANIDVAMCHEWLERGVADGLRKAGVKKVWDSSKAVCLLDHYVPAPTVETAEIHKKIRKDVIDFGLQRYLGETEGVCHQVMVEKGYVLPGRLIVATDSHTTTYGALGAGGAGIGSSEMAYVLATGQLWFRVPETIKFEISGEIPSMVMSKDIILYIAGKYTAEVAQYKSVEYVGPTVERLSVESRMTMSNMSAEIGAKFGFFETDEKTVNYLKDITNQKLVPIEADADAIYEHTYHIQVGNLEPQVAIPYYVDNVKPISELEEVKINQAVLGSCTNGRIEDLKVAASILKGRMVHPNVRLLIIPASKTVYKKALENGLLNIFLDSNAIICNPSCGPCFGQHMGQLASGEICVASINRNFKGRMGSEEAKVYLASPATVAASAIEGKISDPRKYV